METVNGEWYMKCCAPDDPNRLRGPEQAAELIRELGFLPLFSNEIPGFSLEERTCAADWWTDDPKRDPWVWRQLLAEEPELLYGKFFDRRAGFLSAAWVPYFANSRRKGYDFDTRIDEGLAPVRAQKLMSPFLTEGMPNREALHGFALKARAGFGKGGEKNFEGVLTELQMQTYLMIGAFRQRQNRLGQPYGWHIAVITTPEAKLGYEAVTAAYGEAPAESLARLEARCLECFPRAGKDAVRRLLG